MKNFIGAGILPYAIRYEGNKAKPLTSESSDKGNKAKPLTSESSDKGELVFLLGLGNRKMDKNKLYSDFGGGREDKETPSMTAYREFIEETMDMMGNNTKIKNLLKNPSVLHICDNTYHEYIIKIDFNEDITNTYNRIINKLKECMIYKNNKYLTIPSCPVGLLEKIEMRWFTAKEIYENKEKMRPIFFKTFSGFYNKVRLDKKIKNK